MIVYINFLYIDLSPICNHGDCECGASYLGSSSMWGVLSWDELSLR